MDVSMTLDKLKEKVGSGNGRETLNFMDVKVKRTLEPLEKCIVWNRNEKPGTLG